VGPDLAALAGRHPSDEFEFVCVDDGSKDNSRQILEALDRGEAVGLSELVRERAPELGAALAASGRRTRRAIAASASAITGS